MSVTTAELSGVVAPQSQHLLEACCTKCCKLIDMGLHSISLCRQRKVQPVTGSPPGTSFTPCHVSRRVIDTSCPKYQKSVGFFFSCLSIGKRRSKPGNNSFDFGRVHKCKNQKVLCTTFEPQILAGIGQFIWVGKQR